MQILYPGRESFLFQNVWCLTLLLQKSLSYPEGGKEASDELRDLVSGLLTSPDSRLAYSGLQTHFFFSSTDWTSLQHCQSKSGEFSLKVDCIL